MNTLKLRDTEESAPNYMILNLEGKRLTQLFKCQFQGTFFNTPPSS